MAEPHPKRRRRVVGKRRAPAVDAPASPSCLDVVEVEKWATVSPIINRLDSFLPPGLPVPDFLRTHYRRRALAVLGAGEDRVQWLLKEFLFGGDLRAMLSSTNSDSITVWGRDKATGRSTSFPAADAESALRQHNCGLSLYFRASPEMERAFLPSFMQDLGANFASWDRAGGVRGEIETFVARKGHRTDWHFDYMENFTVQLTGTKRWWFRPSGVRYPHRSLGQHFGIDEQKSPLLRTQTNLCRLSDEAFSVPHEEAAYELQRFTSPHLSPPPAGGPACG
eukprot:Hpha_TRINITY_DN1520_c0_g1::TRINITY_DN1520_c0_g1_i1::g.57271::m.57271